MGCGRGEATEIGYVEPVDAVSHNFGGACGTEYYRYQPMSHCFNHADSEVLIAIGMKFTIFAQAGAMPINCCAVEKIVTD